MISVFFRRKLIGSHEIPYIVANNLDSCFICLLAVKLQVIPNLVESSQNYKQRNQCKFNPDKYPQQNEYQINNENIGVSNSE